MKHPTLVSVFSLLTGLLLTSAVTLQAQSGTWTLYPPQANIYTTTVQPPVNADGTSNFKASGKAVIPIQFKLATAPGPVVFQSIYSDGTNSDPATTNDYSFLSFVPSASLPFNQLTNLSAGYTFTTGNCWGGSLRWSVRVTDTQSLFIYYGAEPNTTDCTTVDGGVSNQSGLNMIARSDLRYDTSQVGGTFYDTYSNALTLLGSTPVIRASLVLDSGWFNAPLSDQVINPLQNVTVNGNTFVPTAGSTSTCNLPPATIQITKTSGTPLGDVNEPLTIQPNDNNGQFRIVDCKYMYNLATSSLSGAGSYTVTAVINGSPAAGPATFDLK